MPRTPKEWIGRTDDTPVPWRVRDRVFTRHGCQCAGCGRPIRPGDAWSCDHKQPLILGGENRETNLHPLCAWCHPIKTAKEVAQKSADYKRRLRHSGIKTRPAGRPLLGTYASGWKKFMNGGWERR